jgi:serine/threonine-protein kinase
MAGAEVTIDLTKRGNLVAHDSFAPARAVVAEGPTRLSAETQSLLRSRLRVVSLMLALAFGIFFIREFFLPIRDLVLDAFLAMALLVLCLCAGLLGSRVPLTIGQLRALEMTIFGLATVFFATVEYRLVLYRVREGNAVMAVARIKNTVIYMLALMMLYGNFIPNVWQRTAAVVVPMALMPLLVLTLLSALHPEMVEFTRRVATFELVSEDVLVLLIGALTAIISTYLINTLRTEAFEARRLGQYRLGERLGAGGMGEVYLAEHQLLKRPCAIKLIRPDSAADPRALARFEREVRTTAQLSHWNTVEIYDYGRTEDGTFYFVMEYLPGLNLADLVERHGVLPPERVMNLLRQACQALAEAHAAGPIHRDIKPANVFAAQRGGRYDVTKLLDFGLVKPAAEATSVQLSHEGSVTGTPLYMSPEQATGSARPDHRSDIYSLGAVAYYLLTGRPPFEGGNAIGVLIAHARDAVLPPSRIQPGVPADLERIVLRCLAKSPPDRYQDAEALERDLAACTAADLWTQERATRWWSALPGHLTPPVATPALAETADYQP